MIRRERIEERLQGLDFPVSKEEIVQHGREQEVTPEEMIFFEALPDLRYEAPEEVAEMIVEPEVTRRGRGAEDQLS